MKKALFLDRDGVINIERNYVHSSKNFEFVHGIFQFCSQFQKRGYLIFVITNQAGIDRGYYTQEDFLKLTDWMISEFRSNGVSIEKVYHCPHHPEFSGECECRKPNPGMILMAQSEFNLDLKNSILIGDNQSDIQAGKRAGISYNYLIGEFSMDAFPWDEII
ncbi:MAG: HAD family hydrolase [Candidatus Marinimicrobia bacterium]|nr:HAD family hydrolase [Candidatus Neomarinimicrobiota bacterium]